MKSARIRRLASDDVVQVARLHHSLYRSNEEYTRNIDRAYKLYFHDVYLGNPWYEEQLSPLVYEEADGKITGFLGVMPRSMRIGGRSIRAAISSMFMVEPNSRSSLAAVQLMKAFMSGPQDLSLADEATEPARKLWERLGGHTSALNSIYWTIPLRPAGFLNLRISRRDWLRPLAKASLPFCKTFDAALAAGRGYFHPARPRLLEKNLDVQTLLECARTLWDSQSLHPEYQESSLRWLLETGEHGGAGGRLEKLAVHSPEHGLVGWFIYHLGKGGVAELLQIGFKQNFAKDVLDHLMYRTWSQGAVAVAGRMDRQLMPHLAGNYVMNPRYWMLVHSKNRELIDLIDRGENHLSRLEGEWCLQFHMGRYKGPAAGEFGDPLQRPLATASSETVTAKTGGVEIVESLAEEWRRLCEEGRCNEPFYRPEWVAAYIRAFAQEAKVVVVTARVDGELKAVLPLIEERSYFRGIPIKRLRDAANAHSCRFDIVCAPGSQGEAAVQAIWKFLAERSGWDMMQFSSVPEGSALNSFAQAASSDAFPTERNVSMRSPYLPLTGLGETKDPLVLQSSANFRSIVRRRERQLKSQGTVLLRRVTKADPQMLQRFYDLERSGWKGEEGTAIACSEQTRQFYDEIAANGERFGYLSLFFLEFDGHPVAGQFGLAHAGRYFMPKIGIDENYSKCGPGHLLIHEIMRNCAENGIREYDFTGPWAEYKAKWTSINRSHFTVRIFNRSLRGRALHVLFRMESNARKLARRWLRPENSS
ncbi:MAG TPA: GNAT family N-acetyltransferase [Terriglobia bacterium]|jgi:CelD/BcsL family acetyltransferase involved in cellulose biosynthesis